MSRADETFVILDFDRTLGDTEQLFAAFMAILAEHSELDQPALRRAATESSQRGESFDGAAWVREQLEMTGQASVWRALKQAFAVRTAQTDYLLPGAWELLAYLRDARVGHGILTYGGREWQEMKLAAAGLSELPTIITDDTAKGTQLRRWQQSDGTYVLPPEFGQTIRQQLVLVDDKPLSFADAPESGIVKLCVGRAGDAVLPAGVEPVADLIAVLHRIRHIIE